MNIQEAKEKLKKDGYTSFELKDFDKEFYDYLLPLKCNQERNLKSQYTHIRANGGFHLEGGMEDTSKPKIRLQDKFESFEEATKKKDEIVNMLKTDSNCVLSQLWYYCDLVSMITPDRPEDGVEYLIKERYSKFEKYVYNLTKHFFDFEDTQEFCLFAAMSTYYNDGCVLGNHGDGTGTGRICALLIYLNEEYDEKDGGILILNNEEKVIPTFGKVAIIDLQSFDIQHQVTEVTGGLGRFALLAFVKKKEDMFVDY
jgi:hypothetical protein